MCIGLHVVTANPLICFFLFSIAGAAALPITLPIEVAGPAGTTAAIALAVPPDAAPQVRSLWMRIHGLGYDGMASVRLNNSAWIALTNSSVSVAEPGRSYGGIGGGFATVEMTLALPSGSLADQTNTLEFRFNGTDGVSSAFRVLAVNFLTADGRQVLPPEAFVEEPPNTWVPPLNAPDAIAAGRNLWRGALLVANGLPNAPAIRAHCSDCHTQDGSDLKYFNFSNRSIIARSRFHGLSELEGRQIATYIRSLSVPNPGRPWNPPYQPGPGLDSQPAVNWAAGAGLSSILEKDIDTLPFIFRQSAASGKAPPGRLLVTPDAFRPGGNLNPREIPIALQLPDWNHWLPRVHPLDAWGARFESSAFAQMYADSDHAKPAGAAGQTAADRTAAGQTAADRTAAGQTAFFDAWIKSRTKFLTPHLSAASPQWTPELSNAFYSAQLWQLVKTWEMTQNFTYSSAPSSALQAPSWLNTIPAATAPAEVHIPDGPSGMGGSALTNEYYSNAWYELQVIVNDGNHRHRDRSPIDWVYLIGHFLELQRQGGKPEPARLLVAVIKALQSTDPAIGPANIAEGWRPDQTVDPRIMIASSWDPVFQILPAGLKQAITQCLLTAWLDKTLEYPPVMYFQRGLSAGSYKLPPEYIDISGGKVWEAAPQFQAAGVDAATIQRLEAWGKAYTALAQLFHY
jgi:hypothetical protein